MKKMKKVVNGDKISNLQHAEVSLIYKEPTYSIFLYYYWQYWAMKKPYANSLSKLKLAKITSINGTGSKGLTKLFAWITLLREVSSNLIIVGKLKMSTIFWHKTLV